MSHDHKQSHNHSQKHSHNHSASTFTRAFVIGVTLNFAFVIIEATYGVLVDSVALIADAGHNLSDVVSLLLAWGAGILATKAATEKRTYGFRKATVLASLTSAVLLLAALGAIGWESAQRFVNPQPVAGATIIVVAGIGVVVNTVTALLFMRGQKHDLNIRGAFLHMAVDAGVSLGVVIAGIVILYTGWLWIDPAISLLIVAIVLIGTWALLRDSFNYAIDVAPENIDMAGIREYLLGFEHVTGIHDLHVWPLSTTETALTVHIVVEGPTLHNNFLSTLQQRLHDDFSIEHSTIQFESSTDGGPCRLDRNICV